ncbi:flavin reductase family protein [Variovorax sp. J31P207]|uniref:flavin reductase family protein n=1 Tax=Variovorax sp. J31P207 TaxID=3053510 RepID=UPI0025766275|nr:flavin reductase family protein [Variovorax sp. J31P207]MDM0071573.1 flavin reductase family protein [Variovorax sp. J31P207]
MAALIVPRPIALVTTLGAEGVVNAAPFSLFNMVGEEPPLVMFSINKQADGVLKDTVRNIQRSHEFVVHIADQAMAQALHDCGHPFGPETSELDQTGLSTRPSAKVRVPSIAEAPVAFECVLHDTLESASRYVFFGRVIWLRTRPGLVDPSNLRVDLAQHSPPGRMGAGLYVKTEDVFPLHSTFAGESGVIERNDRRTST